MRKKEFINELGKRFKYVGNIITVESFLRLERYKVEVAEIDHADQKEVHRDTIYFWVKDKARYPQEKVIDVRWGGSYFRIDKEIEEIITGQGIYSRNERVERRKIRERVLEEIDDREEDSR